jgi:hypothetical protein
MGRNTAHLSAWRRGRPPSSAPRVEIAGDENPAPTDMPIGPRVTYRGRAHRRRKPCDALNSRRPQRLGRVLRVAGLRARSRLCRTGRRPLRFRDLSARDLPAGRRRHGPPCSRALLSQGRPADRSPCPALRTVVLLVRATLPAPFLAAALLATPFLPNHLLAVRFCARRFASPLWFAGRRRLPVRPGAFVLFLRRAVLSRGISTVGLGSVTTVRPRNFRPGSTMSVETANSEKPVLGFVGVLGADCCVGRGRSP